MNHNSGSYCSGDEKGKGAAHQVNSRKSNHRWQWSIGQVKTKPEKAPKMPSTSYY